MKNLKKYLISIISFAIACLLLSCNISKSVSTASNAENVEEKVSTYEEDCVVQKLEGDVQTNSIYPLPKEGDIISGFKVKGIYDYYERDAKIVLFEHEKSGAKTFLISNADEDKSCIIGYNTLTTDEKGKPHVCEHITATGGEKFPSKNLILELSNITYNTYINANTFQQITTYPFSSLSDEQLFAIYKVYLDAVFKPRMLNDKRIFDNEAYRYFIDEKGNLNITGAVYNETIANESDKLRRIYYAAEKAFYKGTSASVTMGGIPEHIRELSYEEIKDFHNKYYHPSNMVVLLYGDLDYSKYLKYIDEEHLKNYERKEIDKNENFEYNTEFTLVKEDFPVSADANVENESIYMYCIPLPKDLSSYDSGIFNALINYLYVKDSPLQKKILEKLPKAGFSLSSNLEYSIPSLMLQFNNVNEEDAEVIKEIVESSLEEIKRDGIPESVIEMYVNDNELDAEFLRDSHGLPNGDDRYYMFAYYYKTEKDTNLGFLEYTKGKRDVYKRYKDGTLDKILDRCLSNTDGAVLVGLIPRPGLAEQKEKENREYLKAKYDAMSKEDIEELKKYNAEFDMWIAEDSGGNAESVRVASVSNLPINVVKKQAYEENYEGVRFISSNIDDIKYSEVTLGFDVSHIPYEDLLKLSLLSDIIYELPTVNYTAEEWSAEIYRSCYNASASIKTNYIENGGYTPYFETRFLCLNKNLEKVFNLHKERILNTKIDDLEKIRSKSALYATDMRTAILSEPFDVGVNYMMASVNKDYLYQDYMSGPNVIKFYEEVSKMSDEELLVLCAELEIIYRSIFNVDGMVCKFVSDVDMASNIKEQVLDIRRNLPEYKKEKANYTNEIIAHNDKEAIVIESNANYNLVGIPLSDDTTPYDGKMAVLARAIETEILDSEFRYKRGVYTPMFLASDKRAFIATYRDPNVKVTYDVYKTLPDLFDKIKWNGEKLEDYKLRAYSKFAYPLTKLAAAKQSISETFSETKEKYYNKYAKCMQQIKDISLDDIPYFSDTLKAITGSEYYVTVGGKTKIEEDKSVFDKINYEYVK